MLVSRDPALFLGQSTLRITLLVCAALVLSFVLTGFVTSAYKKERSSLGELHYEHGQSFAQQGESDKAIDEYREALLFSPDRTEYRVSLATALIKAHRLDEAQSHLEQLLQEDPTNGYINLLLARVAVMRHRTKDAIDYYQRAVYEYWPAADIQERRQARWELTGLLSQTGRRTEMIAELIQLYGSSPRDADQRLKIGFLLLQNGAVSEAIRIFRDVSRDFPQSGEAHRGLGQVYFDNGDYVAARHEFQRALKLDPKDREASQRLQLTNSVIEIDPALPNISPDERFRRSESLLSRVLNDTDQCVGTATLPDDLQQRLEAAKKLLQTKNKGKGDPSADMQSAAQQLWKDRKAFCPGKPTADRAVDAVLPKLAYE